MITTHSQVLSVKEEARKIIAEHAKNKYVQESFLDPDSNKYKQILYNYYDNSC